MDGDQYQRLKSLFDQAQGLETERQAAFLEVVGRQDPEQRTQLERMLASDAEPWSWLEDPLRSATGLDSPLDLLRSPLQRGLRVGDYELQSELGHGGMGAVFLARRADQEFEQQVAIKFLRLALPSEELLRRFLQERQILATLQHPGIARLVDGGVTDEGLPYLVMEAISGERIDHYCNRHRLDFAQRVELFQQVCSAVAYAHRHLVVHRDLKPSNILVDTDGQAKLLDFGVAKLLSLEHIPGTLTDTVTGLDPMTPDYASPEQVRGMAISTASDVYSLGVLLHELLVGCRPLQLGGLRRAELERVVSEVEPGWPSSSSCLRDGAAESISLAAARSTYPKRLRQQLRGDLDHILLKAVAKEPERRYVSVVELADDLERHHQGLPVTARRGTRRYRVGKFLRRHRARIAATAVLFVALLGIAISAFRWQDERRRASQAVLQKEEMAAFFFFILEAADPTRALKARVTVSEVLQAFTDLDFFAAFSGDGWAVDHETEARMLNQAGRAYRRLGSYEEAEGLLLRSLELRRRQFGLDAAPTAQSLNDLCALRRVQGEYEQAEFLCRTALHLRRGLEQSGQSTEVPIANWVWGQRLTGQEMEDVAASLNRLSLVLEARGEMKEAESVLREALAIRIRKNGEQHPNVAVLRHNLGGLLMEVDRLDRAEIYLNQAVEAQRQAQGSASLDLAESLTTLAVVYRKTERLQQSEELYEEVIDIYHQRLGEEHPDVARAMSNLGTLLSSQGRLTEAEELYRKAAVKFAKRLPDDHPHLLTVNNKLAVALRKQGRLAEAEALFREVLALREQRLGSAHPYVADTLVGLSLTLMLTENTSAARGYLARAHSIREQHFGARHRRTRDVRSLLEQVSAH